MVNLSQRISRSDLLIPVPLSWICRSFKPPCFTIIWMFVDLASRLEFKGSTSRISIVFYNCLPVFNKFFQSVGWTLNNFAGCNSIDDMLFQSVDRFGLILTCHFTDFEFLFCIQTFLFFKTSLSTFLVLRLCHSGGK